MAASPESSQTDTSSRATSTQKADYPGTAASQLAHPHDSGYKYLFSNKDIFCQLLTRFVDEPLFRQLKPEDVDQLEHSFISDEFLNRESDIIYKVKLPETGAKFDAAKTDTDAEIDAAETDAGAEIDKAAKTDTARSKTTVKTKRPAPGRLPPPALQRERAMEGGRESK